MRVLVVTSEWATPSRPEGGAFIARQVDWLRRAGVEIDVEPFRGATNPINYLKIRRRVRRRIASGRYDVLHAHVGQAGFATVGLYRPMVVTFYGSDLEGIVGQRGRYTLRGWFLRRLSRFVARRADEVIVVSSSMARRLPAGIEFSVIPTTADFDVFRPGSLQEARRALGLPADRRLVLFAGRPEVKVKRYDLAERAVELLPDNVRAELLTISGLPPAGVASYMQACDALLLTSRHEGAPTMVKEALACGLPVVSVDVGDVRETIGGVRGCLVVTDTSPESIGHALAHVLERRERIDVKDVEDVLDPAKQAARVVEIYERLRAGRPQLRVRRPRRIGTSRSKPARNPEPYEK